MQPIRSRRALMLALVVATALTARAEVTPHASTPGVKVTAAVNAFYTAWGAGDVERAASFWTAGARPQFVRSARRSAQVVCRTLYSVRIVSAEITPAQAVVEAEALLTSRSAMPGAIERHTIMRHAIRLVPVGDEWQIDAWVSDEERLAEQLVALPTREQRDRLLATSRDRWTPALVHILVKQVLSLANRDRRELAAEISGDAVHVAEELDDIGSQALALSVACVIARLGPDADISGAIDLGKRSVALAERTGDPDVLAAALVRLGRASGLLDLSETKYYLRAYDLREYVVDEGLIATAASRLAAAYEAGRDLRLALVYAGIAGHLAEEAGDAGAMVSAAMNFGGLYNTIGDIELSAVYFERASQLARKYGFASADTSMVARIVAIEMMLGRPIEPVIERLDRAIELPETRHDALLRSYLFSQRAEAHMQLGDLVSAAADIDEALAALSPENNEPYTALAQLRFRQGRYAEAIDAARLARVNRQANATEILASQQLGDIDQAVALARCVFEQDHEGLQSMADDERQRPMFLDRRYDTQQLLIELLVQRGEPGEALTAAEDAKALVLRQVASNRRRDKREPAPAAPEQVLLNRLQSLNRELLVERGRAKQSALRAELAQVRLALGDAHVRGAAYRRVQSLETGAGRHVVWQYAGSAALEYVVGERQTTIFTLQQGPSGRQLLDVAVVPVSRAELNALVSELSRRISARDLRYVEPAARLYELLIAPVEKSIALAKTLCIVPDGNLWKVPFQLLRNAGGKMLLDRKAIFYAPSIRMLQSATADTRASREPRLLALANPTLGEGTVARYRAHDRSIPLGDLREAEREVNNIARLYRGFETSVHVRGEAREALFKSEAGHYNVLHIATHGLVDDSAPMFSALLLAASNGDGEDGLLEAREIAELHLDADLVVLSACDTAAGRVAAGEGIIGISWGFLAAGARTLVGSQWKTPSLATERLMQAFHESLRQGHAPAEALRRAQLLMVKDGTFDAPLDWAAFIVIGAGM